MGTSRCPVCHGTFGMTEAVCPHCGHDFPSTPERPDAPWWVYALCLAVALVACLGNPDPVGMKVYAPAGEETFDDIQTTEEAQAGADRRETA